MKKITLLMLLFLVTTITTAQQLYLEGGKIASTFDYKNSQGNSLENLQAITSSYMSVGYSNELFTKKLNISLGATYASYGTIGSDNVVGNFMQWDVNYAGLNISLDYKLFKIKKASVYLKGGMSGAFFVQGTQILNKTVIDLKNNDDFDTTLVTMQAGAGFSHPISEDLSFYVQYMYGKSLDMASGAAELKITSNSIGFGMLINISKKTAITKQ